MKLYIKNMVCNRCKMVVKSELEKLGLNPLTVELGEVEIVENNIEHLKIVLIENLHGLGFEWIEDKKSKTIDKIKTLIIDLVHNNDAQININLSTFIAKNLDQEYNTLSHLFSELEACTIEKYFINQKVEKVKELLIYDELTLNQIAFKLNYSSVAYLSNQFKKTTGISPSHFKQHKNVQRKQLEDL